jgi:two-component system response regulator RegA
MVVPNAADVRSLDSALSPAEFRVTVSHSFVEAKGLLDARPPDVLVTDLRLGEYNGLHLVLRGKTANPDMTAVVLSDLDDRGLEADAEGLGATFVVKPVRAEDLAAAVVRTLYRRAGDHTPIRPPFERRSADRRIALGSAPSADERRLGDRRRTPFPVLGVELA